MSTSLRARLSLWNAAGFAVLATVGPDAPYLLLALSLVLLGVGMGVTVAPATGGIMTSVPMGKAGVGSAVNAAIGKGNTACMELGTIGDTACR